MSETPTFTPPLIYTVTPWPTVWPSLAQMTGIRYGSGRLVATALNSSTRLAAVSTDAGLTWTSPTNEPIHGGLCLAFGAGVFVSGGDIPGAPRVAAVAVSTDGMEWSTVSLGVSSASVSDIGFDGSRFCARLSNGMVSTSSDGDTWTSPVPSGVTFSSLRALAAGGGSFVAPHHQQATGIFYSTDGVSWQSSTVIGSFSGFFGYAEYGAGIWMIPVNGGTGFLRSTDGGATWVFNSVPAFTTAPYEVPFYRNGFWMFRPSGSTQARRHAVSLDAGETWQDFTNPAGGEYASPRSAMYTYGAGRFFIPHNAGSVPKGIYTFEWEDAPEPPDGPSYTVVECDPVGLDQIVFDLARRAGVPAHRIDVSGIELTEDYGRIAGFGIGRAASARTMIEILQRGKFFDVTEIGGIVAARRRDRAPDGVIGGDDLRAHAYGETPPTLATRERIEDYEIPAEVRVEYSQLDAEYEPGVEAYTRRVTDASGVLDVDLSSIAMEPDEAAVIAEATLLEAVVARESIESHQVATDTNKALKPGDIKTLEVGDREDVIRITDIGYAYPGIQRLKMLRHDPSVYSSDARGVGRGTSGSVVVQHGATTFELLDAPLVRELDDVPGYFAAMGGIPTIPGVIEGWPGGDLIREEGGVDVEIERQLRPGAIFGATLGALPSAPHTIVDWSEIEVTASGPLSTVTLQQALGGRNLAAVEVRDGGERVGWELIRFLSASHEDGVWTLSGLIRGVNGTEWAIGLHQAGDRFVVLDGAVQVLAEIEPELNIVRRHNAVTIGQEADPDRAVDFAWRGVDRIPWAPCQVSAERVAGTAWLRWRRRDRVGMELQSGAETPLSEETEEYALTILNAAGTEIIRTEVLTSPEYEYADELADFGSQQASLNVRVAQIGALGPGYPAGGVIGVTGEPALPPALPPGDESRVTITVGGAFDEGDTLYFRLMFAEAGVGTHERLYTAEGSGKAAVEDYLTDLEAQVLADFPGLATAISSGGEELMISTTAGVLTGTVTNNTADQILTLAQEAAGASAGQTYVGTLDFYETFGGFDVVGPSLSTKYGAGVSMTANLRVVGITYDAAKALGPSNEALFNVPSSQDGPGSAVSYAFPMNPASVNAINANTGFMAYAQSVSFGTITGLTFPPPRSGVAIVMEPNYRLAEQFWTTTPSNVSSALQPLKYLLKTNRQAQPHFPSGAQQIILVGWLTSIDPATPQSVVEGQVYKISLGGVDFTRTVTSGDAADPFRESILQALVDDIDADPDYEVDVFTANRAPEDPLAPGTWITRIEIRHTDPNTPFTFEASASFGIEATVVNEIVPE